MDGIWENGIAIAKVEKENDSFTCVRFSKDLRFKEVNNGLDEGELSKNLKNWNMKLTEKKLVLANCC